MWHQILRRVPGAVALKISQRSPVLSSFPQYFHTSNVVMEDYMRGGRGRGRVGRTGKAVARTPPPARVDDPWVQVKDDASGQMYWWNQETNETTALGEPKPGGEVGAPVAPQGGVASGLGRVVAEGFAFGVGSSIARSVVGSVFETFGGDASSADEMFGGSETGGENWGDEEQWSEDDEL